MTEPGRILWHTQRQHPEYGHEAAELCVSTAGELLLTTEDADTEATTTLTIGDARALCSALVDHITATDNTTARQEET